MGKLTRRTAPRIAAHNGQLTTTSRDIAETFGKEHKDVVRRINALQCSADFRCAHFYAHPYTLEQNGETYTEYLVTKDGFAFLCMGFTGAKAAAWKEKYIAHFNAMAEKLAKKKQNKPLAVIEPAQTAIKQIAPAAFNPASLIGRGMSPLPEGFAFPPAIAAQIEAAAIQQAMQCIPALRSYLQRLIHATERQPINWQPERIAQTLATASLADALNHQAHADLAGCIKLASALKIVITEAHDKLQATARGEGV